MAEYCGRATGYGHGMAADLDVDGVKEILVASAADGVHAYHPNTGEILWHIDKGGTAIGVVEYAPGSEALITAGPRPALSEADRVHNLWALNPDGSERWSKPAPSQVGSMWIENVHGDATDEIVVLCTDHLWVLGADGTELLRRDLGDVAGRRLALLAQEGSALHSIGLSEDATVTVLAWDDVSLWHELWSVDAPSDVAAMWAGDLGDGTGPLFLVGCEEGEIRGYAAQDGQEVFSASAGFEVRTIDVGNLDGTGAQEVVAGTGDRDFGHVYAFDSSGNELWSVKTGDAFYRTLAWSAPAFADIDDDGLSEMFLGTWWGAVEMYGRVGQGDQAVWKLAEPQIGGARPRVEYYRQV